MILKQLLTQPLAEALPSCSRESTFRLVSVSQQATSQDQPLLWPLLSKGRLRYPLVYHCQGVPYRNLLGAFLATQSMLDYQRQNKFVSYVQEHYSYHKAIIAFSTGFAIHMLVMHAWEAVCVFWCCETDSYAGIVGIYG
jgi:hypothetical protein